jgi:hypothetical protein
VKVWKQVADEGSGYLFSLSDSIRVVENSNPGLLNCLSKGQLVVTSDYSGQHKNATHEAYAFLVTTDEYLTEWLPKLAQFRMRHLPDGRRISFKNANERMRLAALPEFLRTVGDLRCNLVTILVDRNVGSFSNGNRAELVDALPDCFPETAPDGTVEKMLRLASFVALILAGLRQETQPSLWISDHDEALDSHDKREHFAKLATYLIFGLTKWQSAADHVFGTTEMENSPYWSEDLTAVPDLVAGAYCKMAFHLPSILGRKNWVIGMSSSSISDERARLVGSWLAEGSDEMKHVLMRLERLEDGTVKSSAQAFIRH